MTEPETGSVLIEPTEDLPPTLNDQLNELAKHNPIVKYFRHAHLPPSLQMYSLPWAELAVWVCANIPQNAERTVALRKLLEGKDAAVRAALT